MSALKFGFAFCLIVTVGFNQILHADTEIDGTATTNSSFTMTGPVNITSLSVSTITAVSSATITNLTVAGALTYGGTLGKISQVVVSTNSASTTTTSTSYVDTPLSGSITPASTANKILVLVSGALGTATVNERCYYGLSQAGTDQNASGFMTLQVQSVNVYSNGSFVFLGVPSSATSVIYKVRLKSAGGGMCFGDPTGIQENMVLMEIQS